MKKLIVLLMLVGLVGCSQQDYPILHPEVQNPQDYPCGLHLDPYKVVRNGKTEIVCCPEGHAPWLSQPGYCAAK